MLLGVCQQRVASPNLLSAVTSLHARARAGLCSRRIRIYAVDKVPGVKMSVSGAQPKQALGAEAMAGAERLAAAVKLQQKERQKDLNTAAALAKKIVNPSSPDATSSQPQGSKLKQLREMLDSTIDGQHLAKDVVARAIRRRSLRLDDTERPLRLLFAGPSGVGKTAMAIAVCEALLGSCVPDRNFKRFNLSEFSHSSKFNRLTGGDPNYVGYKEGGELTNFVRQVSHADHVIAPRAHGGSRRGSTGLLDHTTCTRRVRTFERRRTFVSGRGPPRETAEWDRAHVVRVATR